MNELVKGGFHHNIQSVRVVEVLEDLIVAAYNDAKGKIDAKMQDSMNAMTGGMNLGGLKLPF